MKLSRMFLLAIAGLLIAAALTGCTTEESESTNKLVTVTIEGEDISIMKDGVDLDLVKDVIFE